jgi:hypothetical protein
MNTVIPNVESAAADVCVTSILLRKASKRVVKAREKLAAAQSADVPNLVFLSLLEKELDEAETAELAAEECWESSMSVLEEAEANEEAA